VSLLAVVVLGRVLGLCEAQNVSDRLFLFMEGVDKACKFRGNVLAILSDVVVD
jgi:hypothetical protein